MDPYIGRQLGDYLISEKIGEGSLGAVYRARHVHLQKDFALKILPRALAGDPAFEARFHDESRSISELRHPGIVQVHETGCQEGEHFLAMDCVAGPEGRPLNLQEWLKNRPNGRMPQEKVQQWAIQIAEALSYAHSRGVVHRNIKPSNILIDSAGNVRLTDLGLAKVVGGEFIRSRIQKSMQGPATAEASEAGGRASSLDTYDYMAPEQRTEGGAISPRTDVYSLGVVLYQMLTGKRPGSYAQPPSRALPWLQKRWDELIALCLAEAPADRYGNAEQVLRALRSAQRTSGSKVPLMIAAGTAVVAAAAVLAIAMIGGRREPPVPPAENAPAPTQTLQEKWVQSQAAAEKERKQKLLKTAQENDSKEHGKTALAALDELLELDPGNIEAVALKQKIEDYYVLKVGDMLTNSIGMKLMFIPPGDFMMGTPDDDKIRGSDMEVPQHGIRIAKGFYLGKYEVTVGQFRAFVKDTGYETEAETGNGGGGWIKGEYVGRKEFNWRNMGFKQTDDHPVVNVSWNDVQVFCEWLSAREKKHYRLPTEAEWEYACRAGTTTRFNTGNTLTTEQANIVGDSETKDDSHARWKTTPVGSFPANAWGLHDMHGNVWEWCQTLTKSYPYQVEDDRESLVDRTMTRLMRGGSWYAYSWYVRSAERLWNTPDIRGIDLGFRVCLELD